MDQYISASGLTGDYAIGNGQYTWDETNGKYTNINGCEIRHDIIAVLWNSWNMYVPALVILNGPIAPAPRVPSCIGSYMNETPQGTQKAITVVG